MSDSLVVVSPHHPDNSFWFPLTLHKVGKKLMTAIETAAGGAHPPGRHSCPGAALSARLGMLCARDDICIVTTVGDIATTPG